MATLKPVDFDPFSSNNAPPSQSKLKPVDFDPFAAPATPKKQEEAKQLPGETLPREGTLSEGIKLGVARTGRDLAGGISSLLDIPRIVTDPVFKLAEPAARAAGAEGIGDFLKSEYSAPTFQQKAIDAYDESTGGYLKPRDFASKASDVAAQFFAAPLGPKSMQVAGEAMMQGGKKALSPIGEWIGKALEVRPDRVQAIQEAGLPLTVPAASDNASVKTLSNISSELPGGGSLRKTMEGVHKTAGDDLANLGYTGTTTPTAAGGAAEEGLQVWQAGKRARFQKLDAALKDMVPDEAMTDISSLPGKLQQLANAPGLTGAQVDSNASLPALKEIEKLLKYTDDMSMTGQSGKTLLDVPFGAVKQARTNIGHLLEQGPIKTQDDRLAREAYEALSDVMRGTVGKTGGEKGLQLFDLRNRAWSNFAQENADFTVKMAKKLGDKPEAVFNMLSSGNKQGASQATRLLAKLSQPERDTLRDAWIHQAGGGEQFTPQKWIRYYQGMSKEAKNAFFMGRKDLMAATDDLMKGLSQYQDVGKFGNPSRSGILNAMANFLQGHSVLAGGAAGGAALVAPKAVIGGYLTNKAFASAMNSPKVVKWLAGVKDVQNEDQFAQALKKAPRDVQAALASFQSLNNNTNQGGSDGEEER